MSIKDFCDAVDFDTGRLLDQYTMKPLSQLSNSYFQWINMVLFFVRLAFIKKRPSLLLVQTANRQDERNKKKHFVLIFGFFYQCLVHHFIMFEKIDPGNSVKIIPMPKFKPGTAVREQV